MMNAMGRGRGIEVDDAPARRAAEIELELETLGKHYVNADRPGLLEKAGRFDYRDPKLQQARTARERGRREIEEHAERLLAEHAALCTKDKALAPLDRPDGLQLAHVRARLRTEQLTAGRFRALLRLSSAKLTADLRRQKLAECEAEITHLSKLITRIEAAREPAE